MMRPTSASAARARSPIKSVSLPTKQVGSVPKTRVPNSRITPTKPVDTKQYKRPATSSVQAKQPVKKSAINTDISNALSQIHQTVKKIDETDKKIKAATVIQRFWRRRSKRMLMLLANEAIKMSENIQIQQRMRLHRDLQGRDSVDTINFWDAKEDFNVFTQTDSLQQPSVLLPKQRESAGENKLSALNEMLKLKQFQISEADEEDFEQFLQKLSTNPTPNKSPLQIEQPEPLPNPNEFTLGQQEPTALLSVTPPPATPTSRYLLSEVQEHSLEQSNSVKHHEELFTEEQSLEELKQKTHGLSCDTESPDFYSIQKTEKCSKPLGSDQFDPKETYHKTPEPPTHEILATRPQVHKLDLQQEVQMMISSGTKSQASAAQNKSRYDEFMNFLDNVEQEFSQNEATSRSLAPSATSKPADDFSLVSVSDPREAYSRVRERLMELELERDEQAKAIDLMRQLRQKEKTVTKQNLAALHAEAQKQQDQLKQEMAERIEKQVKMIEDLLTDKKNLQGKLETVFKQQNDNNGFLEKQRKVIEDRYQVELRKNREAWQAAEKVRREKWEKERIHEIRSQTVKGLEPEIQRIVERNKEELRKAHDLHQQDSRSKKQDLTEEHERKTQELRQKLIGERDEAVDRERERGQNKLHEQYERLETQFDAERRRWKDNQFSESSRVEQMLKQENDRLKEELKSVRLRCQKELAEKQTECEEQLQAGQRRNATELKQLREKMVIEREEMQAAIQKKQQDQNLEVQRQMRENMIIERNREIEAIIEKLGDETHSTQKQLVTQYEYKQKQMQVQHDEELASQKADLDELRTRVAAETDTKQMLDDNLRVLARRVSDLEIELAEKKERIGQARRQNDELQCKLDSIYEEQAAVRSKLDQKMRECLEAKDSDLRRVQSEKQAQEHALASQVDSLRMQNKQELELIQEKVQAALAKKKEVIEQLSEELRLKELQISKLKEMMHRQRTELLQ